MTKDGRTALSEAAKIGANETVELLIKHGADLEVSPSKYGDTPLVNAASKGQTAIVKILRSAGANVFAAQSGWWTAFHFALHNEWGGMACIILDYSLSVNAAAMGGTPTSQFAAKAGMMDITKLLLDMGAEIESSR